MALGEIIQAYLAHDDWQPTTNLNGVPMLVTRSFVSPESRARIQELEAQSREIKTELDAIYRAYAPFLVLVMNADGVVTEAELEAVRQIDAEYGYGEIRLEGDERFHEWSDAVAAVLDGRGMDLADAHKAVLKLKPAAREKLMEYCERIAGAEGRSEAEEEVLQAIREALFPPEEKPAPAPSAQPAAAAPSVQPTIRGLRHSGSCSACGAIIPQRLAQCPRCGAMPAPHV